MALLTDKNTEKDLSERLSEFIQFGMIFNYMLDIGKINISDLDKLFFSTDRDKSILIYSNILKKIEPSYIDKAYTIYSHEYPNTYNYENDTYDQYINSCCINSLISKIASSDSIKIDKTYYNTYNFLLEQSGVKYAGK